MSRQKAIQRQQQATKQKDYINRCKQEGKAARIIQSSGKPSNDDLTPAEAEARIKSVTDRLTVVKKSQAPPPMPVTKSNPVTSRKRKPSTSQDRPQPEKVIPPNLRVRQNSFDPVLKSNRSKENSSPSQGKDEVPMMYVDVFVDSDGEPIKHRIPVFRGDQAGQLAE